MITDEAKTWVVNLVCLKPKDLGIAAELLTSLARISHRFLPPRGGALNKQTREFLVASFSAQDLIILPAGRRWLPKIARTCQNQLAEGLNVDTPCTAVRTTAFDKRSEGRNSGLN